MPEHSELKGGPHNRLKTFWNGKLYLAWKILKRTIATFIKEDSVTFASSIAFYTIFSMPAVLIISIAIAATFYEKDVVHEELINQISLLIGSESAHEVQRILKNASINSTGPVAKIIGIATLVFSATTVFLSLQSSLNRIWKIKAKPERGIVKFFINRLLSLAMVISLGFILLVSLIVDTLLVLFQKAVVVKLPNIALTFLSAFNILISIGFITVMFALIFKMLPDAKIKWRDVWVGAFITTVLFTIGKFLIGLYIGNSSLGTAYGAAGSLVVILIWVYYSTAILLIGAQLTYVYIDELGREIEPYKNAVRVKQVEIETG